MGVPVPGPVIRLADLPLAEHARGERYAATHASVAQALGLSLIGARLMRVPPGRTAWPFHAHLANDELYVILEGEGELRIGETRHPVRAGDAAGCPAGGAETAHQLVNTGTVDLVYLCVSSMHAPEVMVYPDSGKTVVLAGKAALGPGEASFRHVSRIADAVDYWDGEEG